MSAPIPLILGIDPGSRATGFGLVHPQGRKIVVVDHGVIRPRADDDLPTRLATIATRIEALVEKHSPTHGAIEDVFVSRDPRAALKLGQARGAAIVAMARSGLEVASYPPAVVKRAVTGSGRADKDQVGRMVQALLGLKKRPAKDASDALAVAICRLRSMR